MMGSEPSTGVGSSRGSPGGDGFRRHADEQLDHGCGSTAAHRTSTRPPAASTPTSQPCSPSSTSMSTDRNGLSAGQRESLARAGVFVDGRLHPALRAGLDAVAHPSARLEVEVATLSSTRLHQGWVDRVSALVVDHGDEGADLLEVEAAFLPATIAHLTHLQPRPRLDGRGGPVDGDAL